MERLALMWHMSASEIFSMPIATIGPPSVPTIRSSRGLLSDKDVPKGFTNIRINFKVKTDVDNMERLKRLTAYSPVLNTITQGAKVDIQVEAK